MAYTDEFKEEVVGYLLGVEGEELPTLEDAKDKYGVSVTTLKKWAEAAEDVVSIVSDSELEDEPVEELENEKQTQPDETSSDENGDDGEADETQTSEDTSEKATEKASKVTEPMIGGVTQREHQRLRFLGYR